MASSKVSMTITVSGNDIATLSINGVEKGKVGPGKAEKTFTFDCVDNGVTAIEIDEYDATDEIKQAEAEKAGTSKPAGKRP